MCENEEGKLTITIQIEKVLPKTRYFTYSGLKVISVQRGGVGPGQYNQRHIIYITKE